MFCPECGSELEIGDKFCLHCGTKIDENLDESITQTPVAPAADPYPAPDESNKYSANEPQNYFDDGTYQNPVAEQHPSDYQIPTDRSFTPEQPKQKKKMNKVLMILLPFVAVAVIAVAVIMFFIFGQSSNTINLNDYLVVTYYGYDGYGIATVDFDEERFLSDNGELIKLASDYEDYIPYEYINSEDLTEYFCDWCISWEVSEYTDLSNGDMITVSLALDEMSETVFKVKGEFELAPATFTVSNLTEVDEFDPFEKVSVTLEGIAPHGYVTVDVDNDELYMQYLNVYVDNDSELSNDDTVTLNVELRTDTEAYISKFGMLPAKTTKTYTVAGLPEYISSSSEITESDLNTIRQAAETAVYNHVDDTFGTREHLNDVEYVGYYFQNATEDSYGNYENMLTVIFRVNLYVEQNEETQYITYYHIIRYFNISANSDGVCNINLNDYDESPYRYYPEVLSGYYYYGYESLDDLYDKLIKVELSDYTYEKNFN